MKTWWIWFKHAIYNQFHPFRGCPPYSPWQSSRGWKRIWSWRFGFHWRWDKNYIRPPPPMDTFEQRMNCYGFTKHGKRL